MRALILLVVVFLTTPTYGYGVNIETYIPVNAPQYFPIVSDSTGRLLPTVDQPAYVAALIEQESCITLTHSFCWNPRAKLSTKRELGLGMGQLTKAYNANGSVRFDSLTELRSRNYMELKDLSWSNITSRPDLQIKAIVLMLHANTSILTDKMGPMSSLAFLDSSYNGGIGRVLKDRRYCSLSANCDPNVWFGNVETHCLGGNKAIYGKRSACDINREHVKSVLTQRLKKYMLAFE